MFVIATKRSPIDINKIILREFVLKSGHITNVIMITRAPIIESPAAVVDKTLFISPCANSVWGPDVVYSRVYSEIFWDAMLILSFRYFLLFSTFEHRNPEKLGPVMIETTGRPPSVCGAVAWIKIRTLIFSTLFFIEEIQMKNADFDANVSIKVWRKC